MEMAHRSLAFAQEEMVAFSVPEIRAHHLAFIITIMTLKFLSVMTFTFRVVSMDSEAVLILVEDLSVLRMRTGVIILAEEAIFLLTSWRYFKSNFRLSADN